MRVYNAVDDAAIVLCFLRPCASGRVHFTDSPDKFKRGKKVINVVSHAQWPAVLAAAQIKNALKRGVVTQPVQQQQQQQQHTG